MSTWDTPATDAIVAETVKNLTAHGFIVEVVETRQEALEKIKRMIPAGAEVMSGSSTTLNEIGLMDYINSNESEWINLQAQLYAENDKEKRDELRRSSVTADYFLASVNAISQTGALVAVDNTGSRVGAFPFAAQHLVLVASTQKITDSIESAMQRVREYVWPLEKKRAFAAYGIDSMTRKWVIMENENEVGRTQVILVKEMLGF
jgi:L-lactate utilization protein LutB